MKLIIAIIRPEDFESVQSALRDTEASLISVSEIRYGREESRACYRGTEYRSMPVRLRLEIVQLNGSAAPEAIEAISSAISGSLNCREAEILVMELDDAMRFRARQRATVRA